MAVKPKNVYEDSWAYTLPHEIGFLIQELADQEAQNLQLSKMSTSDYLERRVRMLAAENLSQEAQERARTRAQERTERRKKNAERLAQQQQQEEVSEVVQE